MRHPSHNSGRTRRALSLRCFKTFTWKALLTGWPSGANLWCTIPWQSKNQQYYWFSIRFSVIFSVSAIICFHSVLCDFSFDAVIVDPRFVTSDDPFQDYIAFLWGFPVSTTLSGATFVQEWVVSVQSCHKPFSSPNVPSKSCERTTFPNEVLLSF
jgi:hypothetical protein